MNFVAADFTAGNFTAENFATGNFSTINSPHGLLATENITALSFTAWYFRRVKFRCQKLHRRKFRLVKYLLR